MDENSKTICSWWKKHGFPPYLDGKIPNWKVIAKDKDIIDFYIEQGISIIPVNKGQKTPAIPWKRYQHERAPAEQIYEWYFRDGYDLAAVCGSISGNLVVEDYDNPKLYEKVRSKGTERTTLVVKTSRVGRKRKRHVCWLCRGPVKSSNLRSKGLEIDIRGEGTYVKIPPSLKDPDTGLRYEFDEAMTPIAHWDGEYLHDYQDLLRRRLKVKLEAPRAHVADLLKPAHEGERHDRLLKLVSWIRHCKTGRKTALEKVLAWNKKCLPPEDEDAIVSQFATIFDRPTPYAFKWDQPPREIYPIDVETAAIELLESPQILDLFIEDSDRIIVMDEATRKIELLVCVSAFSEKPLNLSLLGPWSTGKTVTVIAVTSYFPGVWSLGGLSPKALIHQNGVYDEDRDISVIDLTKKIILFLEPPQRETLAMLKPLLSRDKFEIEYKYVEKESGKTESAVLRGYPTCIFCGVTSKYTEEYTSRWMTASPGASREKIEAVIRRKGEAARNPEKYAPGDIYRALRCAFSILGDGAPYEVVIPFADSLSECFRAKLPADMRFFTMLLSLIKTTTILHTRQRERDNSGRLVATLEDYKIAKEIFSAFEKPTVYGVGQNVLDFYHQCLVGQEEDLEGIRRTYDQLLSNYSQAFGRRISRSQMLTEYLRPLERSGLADIVKDPDDRRRNLVIPLPIGDRSLIDDDGFRDRLTEKSNLSNNGGRKESKYKSLKINSISTPPTISDRLNSPEKDVEEEERPENWLDRFRKEVKPK